MKTLTQEEKRIKIAEACGITVCGGCFCAIDETCCGCGTSKESHGSPFYEGHSFIPMGCRCGYDKQPQPKFGGVGNGVPDYFNDLNAMHEAEKQLAQIDIELGRPASLVGGYPKSIQQVCNGGVLGCFNHISATAAQRAEAFGLTLKLWKEGE